MTGLVLLDPLGLLALVSIPVLVLLDRASRRRTLVVLPSLYLARRLADGAARAESRPSRGRPRASLVLRLIAAALASLLLARPAFVEAASPARRYVVLLDLSASTSAVESGRSRFEAIRADLAAFLGTLQPVDRVLLLAAPGGSPLAAEGDPATVRGVLPPRPFDLPDDWPAALAAARAAAARIGEGAADPVLVFTDHAIEGAGPARVVSRGSALENAGIVAVTFPLGAAGDPFAVVAATVAGRVRLFADDEVRATIDVAPGALSGATLAGAARAREIRVEMAGDSLAADDRVPLAPASRRDVSVAFTGRPADPALRRAIALLPGVRIDADEAATDLEISVGAAPVLGARETILIDPPAGRIEGVGRIAESASPVRALRDGDERVGGIASLGRVGVAAARRIEPEPSASVILFASLDPGGEAPIVARHGGVLVFAFDPAATRWPESASWPVFWAALVDARFGGGGDTRVVRTGAGVAVPAEGGAAAVLVGPDGTRSTLAPSSGAYRFVPSSVGVYRIEAGGDGDETIAAALLARGESACPGAERPFAPDVTDDSVGPRVARRGEAPMRVALASLAALAVLLALVAARREG